MESRQMDVSRLAELSALALLAAKVKLSLGRVRRAGTVIPTERIRLEGAVRYLQRLLEGLNEYGMAAGDARPAGPDQLYAVDSYLTAAPALCFAANQGSAHMDSSDVDAMQAILSQMKTEIESALSSPGTKAAALELAEGFFAALADHAIGQHDEIIRGSPE